MEATYQHKANISRSAVLNFAGQGLQIVAALICMPFISRTLGTDRLGLLSLVWVIVGYFSLLDFGLGAAVTKTVSGAIGSGHRQRISSIFWTATQLQFVLGLFGLLVIIASTNVLVANVLKVPVDLIGEAKISLYLCAIAFPFVLTSSSVVGLLQAFHKFDVINYIQVPLSIAQFVLPLLCGLWWPNLAFVVAILLATRVLALLLYFLLAKKVFPHLLQEVRFDKSEFRTLFSFGGWLTVSNGISPLMVYADRFLLGALHSMSSVAFYAVPCDSVMRMLIVPRSLMSVLFPVFSATSDSGRLNELVQRAAKYILLLVGCPAVVLIIYAHDLMVIWMGKDFAANGSLAFQILLVGILACSVAQVPYILLQSVGRVDFTAKLHTVEFVLYLFSAYFFIKLWGVTGAAAIWSIRLVLEAVVLFIKVNSLELCSLKWTGAYGMSGLTAFFVISVITGIVVNMNIYNNHVKLLFFIVFVATGSKIVWSYLIEHADRARFIEIFAKNKL